MNPTTRVFLVDDHSVVLEGLSGILKREAGIEIVGEAVEAETALRLIPETDPDVVVLDHRLPGMQGDGLCAELLRRRVTAAIVILSAHLDEDVVQACFRAGARGYVVKDVDASELKRAIRVVARGGTHIDPKVAGRMISRAARLEPRAANSLRSIEIEILRHVSEGKTNAQIGKALGISRYTVSSRLATIFRKLGVRQRAEAVAAAIRRGLVTTEEGPVS